MLSGWGTLAGAGAIVIAALFGRSALSDYRNQRVTDKEIEVADQALTAAYRAEEAVEGMRARWMPASELNATEEQLKELGMKLDGMPDAERSAYISRGVIYRRAEYFKDDFEAIFEAIPRVRAFFGKDVADALKAFPRARNRILSSSDMLPVITRDQDADNETSKSIRRDVYGKWQEDDVDPIGEMVSAALNTLEQHLLPKIRPEIKDA
tara:strand:+ start:128973 stop:129599 length:627 start_codon:yes stop_codon:yes gene_type:complete